MLPIVIFLILAFCGMLALFLLSPRYFSYMPERQIFSPWDTTLIVWIVILSLYVLVHDELYPVSEQFVCGITIWVFTFSLSSVVSFILFPSYKKEKWEVCEKNVDFITVLALVLVPFAVYKAVQHAYMIGSPEELFYTLLFEHLLAKKNSFPEHIIHLYLSQLVQ